MDLTVIGIPRLSPWNVSVRTSGRYPGGDYPLRAPRCALRRSGWCSDFPIRFASDRLSGTAHITIPLLDVFDQTPEMFEASPRGEASIYLVLLLTMSMRIYFVTSILCFKKVYQFVYIGSSTHPFCWIGNIVVLCKT